MGFAVALELSDFGHRFPLHAGPGVVSGDVFAANGPIRKHVTFGQVGVMGNGEEASTGGFGQGIKPGPEIFWIGIFIGSDRIDGGCFFTVESGHDDPVKVHAIGSLGPFPPDDGCKDAGFIVRICCGD